MSLSQGLFVLSGLELSSTAPYWVNNLLGTAINLNGSDQYINVPVADTDYLGDLTIIWSGLIRTGSAFRHFAGKHTSNGQNTNPFDFRTDNAATPNMFLIRARGSGDDRLWSGPPVVLNKYIQYAVTFASPMESTPIFYQNTIQTTASGAGGSATGTVTGNNADIRIGIRADGAVKMDGILSYFYIFKRVLSGSEIKQIFSDPFQIYVKPIKPALNTGV